MSVYVAPWSSQASAEYEKGGLKFQNLINRRLFVFYALFAWVVLFFTNCTIRVGHWQNRLVLFSTDAYYWPMSLKSHHQIATVYHRMNMYEKGLYHYNVSLTIHDDNALTDYCIAQAYIETSRFDEALVQFEKIFKGHGIGFGGYNTFALFADYGFLLVIKKRYEEAIPQIEHGLKMNGDLPHGWNGLGMAYANIGAFQEAQDALGNGLKYDPEHPFLWNNLGAVWMMAGHFEQAPQAIEKAMSLEPDNPIFQFNYQYLVHISEGKGEELEKQGVKPRMDIFYNRMQ